MVKAPIPNQKLAAAWGASVAEGINANAATGEAVVRFPGGTATVPGQPPPFRAYDAPAPWTAVPCKLADGTWTVRIYAGKCVWRGTGALSPMSISDDVGDIERTEGLQALGVPDYTVPAALFSKTADIYIHVLAAKDDDGAGPFWGFNRQSSAAAVTEGGNLVSVAIASVRLNPDGIPIVRQLPAPGVLVFGGPGPMLFDLRTDAEGTQEVYIPSALRGSAVRFNGADCYNANTGLTSDDWQPKSGTVSVSVRWNNSNSRYEWIFGTDGNAIVTVVIGTAAQPLRHGSVNISMFGPDDHSLEAYNDGSDYRPWVFQLLDFHDGNTSSPASFDVVIRDNGGPNVDYITPGDLADRLSTTIVNQAMVDTLDAYDYWQPHVKRTGVAGTYYVGDPSNPDAWTDLASAISSVISGSEPIDLKTWMSNIEQRLAALEGN